MANSSEVPDLVPCGSDEEDDDEAAWDEMEETSQPVQCLFCSKTFPSILETVSHAAEGHKFDLKILSKKYNMDTYSYIKLVNFIRMHNMGADELMVCKEPLWDLDMYLKPVLENDPWLMYDFEEDRVLSEPRNFTPTGYHVVNSEDGKVTLTEAHFRELQNNLEGLHMALAQKNDEIQILQGDIARMRSLSRALLEAGISDKSSVEADLDTVVKGIKLEDDEAYFSSYAHFGIHHEMLSDKVRTETYRNALLSNEKQIKGITVLDLGCGTGILSMFCAQAGAEKVVAVDQSDIIYHAMDIVRENKLEDQIQLIKGRLEDLDNIPKVDAIISEWMGYLLLFEGMLDSVIHARDHHLKPGGLLLPNRCDMSLVGLSDLERHNELIGFWEDVYSFKMSGLRKETVHVPAVEIARPESVVTTSFKLRELDLNKCTSRELSYCVPFELKALHTSGEVLLTSLAGYFDVFFDLDNPVSFSTGPLATPTHWKQTVFFLDEPFLLQPGEIIKGTFECLRQKKDCRSLKIYIQLEGKEKFQYIVS
ncbi:protein arginine N-methyltransferase 1 [Neocloeon triangulifer]|uniref:protein arginine N-methyltransferase 1 n=1 Tax=Neocloeon triangulifer TaxID=2078957 RepID=UPI00286ED8F4|nr:protein arginine N-methyltransferase 1 [Neocloeon triangulifer]